MYQKYSATLDLELHTIYACLTITYEEDNQSVLSSIDEESWARDIVWDEEVFCPVSFKRLLGQSLSPSEWRSSFEDRQAMTELMHEVLKSNASLMKQQFTFSFDDGSDDGSSQFGNRQSHCHRDLVALYGTPMGHRTSQVLRAIARGWHKILELNKKFKKPFNFHFRKTPPGAETYNLNGVLVRRKTQ